MEPEDDPRLAEIAAAILRSYQTHGELRHFEGGMLPSREAVWSIVDHLLRMLFPGFLEPGETRADEAPQRIAERLQSVDLALRAEVEKALQFRAGPSLSLDTRKEQARGTVHRLLGVIPAIRDVLATDIEAAYEGDPAAPSRTEVIVAYPGLQAIAVHRIAHSLHREQVPLIPRMMSECAHSRTGIDIHPGARIGNRFFIDHGTGVVIGETSIVGDNVRIYQGVTLGARALPRDEAGRVVKGLKRHPEVEADVTIYSGATVLGDVRIGRGSVIGGNVWLTQSIPPRTRILIRPPQQIHLDRVQDDFQI